jgi:chorismate mutase
MLLVTKRRKNTMLNRGHLAIVIAFAVSGMATARAQNGVERLQALVEMSARRLALAEQVALAKWDSHTPVDDPSREAQVIESAVKQGEAAGLDGASVSNFFKAQIEANKTVQYHLLSDWYRARSAPAHPPINLTKTVRPELDRLQTDLIKALADTTSIRADTACHAEVASAIGKYVSSHHRSSRLFDAIVLDRALAAACVPK